MREYIRHPADIPIEFQQDSPSLSHNETLANISQGGLAFHTHTAAGGGHGDTDPHRAASTGVSGACTRGLVPPVRHRLRRRRGTARFGRCIPRPHGRTALPHRALQTNGAAHPGTPTERATSRAGMDQLNSPSSSRRLKPVTRTTSTTPPPNPIEHAARNLLNPEQRLDELETRLSFQDHTVHQLNDALTDQQRQIDRLHAEIDTLRQRIESVSAAMPTQAGEDEVPPHY